MTVILMHPNDEIFFADFQKELIETLFDDGRIIYSQVPLWIELGDFDLKEKSQIKHIEIGKLCVTDNSVYCPVLIELDKRKINSKLTLVCLHNGNNFTADDAALLKQKPVRQLKVFRLGIVQEHGPHAKSISKSVWCKLHHTTSTVE